MRKSKLALEKVSSLVIFSGHRAMGSLPTLRYWGRSSSGLCQLKVGSPVGLVSGDSGRKARRFVLPGASRVLESAPVGGSGKFNSQGIPQLTMGSTGRGVTSGPAKPGWLSGRAG